MNWKKERKSELVKAQKRKMDPSSPDSAPINQGLMDFILLAMKVDDGFVQRGRIHGA
ncbi:hypothetical protein [Escherichia coli]|uniref:hypothetical protein n=1 Tax=Escherichia coli TaxID=562 RepID=UPI001594ED8B|nr:hypothetical protein [Escherichia coli]